MKNKNVLARKTKIKSESGVQWHKIIYQYICSKTSYLQTFKLLYTKWCVMMEDRWPTWTSFELLNEDPTVYLSRNIESDVLQ